MKKLSLLAASLALPLLLTACSSEAPPEERTTVKAPSPAPKEATPTEEAIIPLASLSPETQEYYAELKEALPQLEAYAQARIKEGGLGGGTLSPEELKANDIELSEGATFGYSGENWSFDYPVNLTFSLASPESPTVDLPQTLHYTSLYNSIQVTRRVEAATLDPILLQEAPVVFQAVEEFLKLNPGSVPTVGKKDGKYIIDDTFAWSKEADEKPTTVPLNVAGDWMITFESRGNEGTVTISANSTYDKAYSDETHDSVVFLLGEPATVGYYRWLTVK